MTVVFPSNESSHNTRFNWQWLCAIVETWRLQEDEKLKRLDSRDRAYYSQLQVETADAEIAQVRVEHLEPIAQKRWSPQTKRWVEIFIVLLGAFTFSTVPQLLGAASNRGALATSAGFVGGGAIAWFTHDRAAKALGAARRRHDSQQALASLNQQEASYPVKSELTKHYFDAQRTRVQQVEADNLKSQFHVDLGLAVATSAIEGGAAFLLTLPAGLMLAGLAGGFPVLVIWLAALFQSDHVDFADAAQDLVHSYEGFLPNANIPETQALKAYELDGTFQFFTSVHASLVRTPDGVRTKARSEFARIRIQELETEGFQQVKARQQKFECDCEQLQQTLPKPNPEDFDTAGYRAFEEHPAYQRACQAYQEKLRLAIAALQTKLEDDLEMLRTEYGQKIQHWQAVKTEANEDFRRAEES